MLIGLLIFAVGSLISLKLIKNTELLGQKEILSANLEYLHSSAMTRMQGADLQAEFEDYRTSHPELDACLKGSGTSCDTRFTNWATFTGTTLGNALNNRSGLKTPNCSDTGPDCIFRTQLLYRLKCDNTTTCHQVEFNIQSSYTGVLANSNDSVGQQIMPLAERNSIVTIPAEMPEMKKCPNGKIAVGLNHSTGEVVCSTPSTCLNGSCHYPNPGGTSCTGGTAQNGVGFDSSGGAGVDVNCTRIPSFEVGSEFSLAKDSKDLPKYCPNDISLYSDCRNMDDNTVVRYKFDRKHTYRCFQSLSESQNQSALAPLSHCGINVSGDPLLNTVIEREIQDPDPTNTCNCCTPRIVSTVQITYTGAVVEQIVPEGANFIEVKLWGAGGGGDGNSLGGPGGFTKGQIPVEENSRLKIVVGGGGFQHHYGGLGPASFGFGGRGYFSGSFPRNYFGNASGGGLTGIFLNSVSRENALAIAGGGGGAEGANFIGTHGGPGNHETLSGGKTSMVGQDLPNVWNIERWGAGGGGYLGGTAGGAGVAGKGGTGFVIASAREPSIEASSFGSYNPPANTDPDYKWPYGLAGPNHDVAGTSGYAVIRYRKICSP